MTTHRQISRRDFLRQSAGAGFALGLPALLYRRAFAQVDPPSGRIRIGCIGVGGLGRGNLGKFIKDVIAVCEVDKTRLDEARARVEKSNGRPESTVEETWAAKGPDGVSVNLHLMFTRGVPAASTFDLRIFSAAEPAFYRIYRGEQVVDFVRSVSTGVNRVPMVELKVTGSGKLATAVNGSEKIIAIKSKIKSALFGGEGLFFATLRGPGKVWLQSLPLSRLAGRIVAAVPGFGRGGREEGSILGGLGRILDGDNS